MPRRRKRNISGLRPLAFEESPKSIAHNIPSPVYASDRPATANVVTLDGTIPIPWVSPQFINDPTPHIKGRRTRRVRSGIDHLPLTRSRIKTTQGVNATCSHPGELNNPDKYQPLRFIGETSLSSDSSRENITIDERDFEPNLQSIDGKLGDKTPFKEILQPKSPEIPDITSCNIETPVLTTPLKDLPGNSVIEDQHPETVTSPQLPLETQNRPSEERQAKKTRRLFQIDGDIGFDSVPSRRLLRQRRAKENFFSNFGLPKTPQQQRLRHPDILVYDTPEEDYGLSVRERRQRAMKRQ